MLLDLAVADQLIEVLPASEKTMDYNNEKRTLFCKMNVKSNKTQRVNYKFYNTIITDLS